jgi:YggT family protein
MIFAIFVSCTAVALGSWAIRSRRINPFGSAGQLIRKTTDPVLAPIERWLLRRGGNPQHAGLWLLGISLGGGIILITTAQWFATALTRSRRLLASGPRGLLSLLVYYGSQVLLLALIVRVIGSWFGVGRYNAWMRPAYVLTDWLVEPLRKVVPPLGMIDITPIIAWFLVLLLRGLILSIL